MRGYGAPCDGIILASFGNTGHQEVVALRPDIPVVGIASAAFSITHALGGPFGIVTFGKSLVPGLRAMAEEARVAEKLLDITTLDIDDFGDAGTVQLRYQDEFETLCHQMARRGVRSIVMGGGPLAGLAQRLAPRCAVPLIDGTQAAINIMRTLVGWKTAQGALRLNSGAS